MSVLDKVVNSTVENYKKQEGVEKAFDPATIMLFADLIAQLIAMVKGCKKDPAEGLQMVKDPSMLQRVVARRTVRKNLDDADRQHGKAMTEALLNTGKTLSKDDVAQLYHEV